jgi:hypothetical protein
VGRGNKGIKPMLADSVSTIRASEAVLAGERLPGVFV